MNRRCRSAHQRKRSRLSVKFEWTILSASGSVVEETAAMWITTSMSRQRFSSHSNIASGTGTRWLTAERDEGYTLSPQTVVAAIEREQPDLVALTPSHERRYGAIIALSNVLRLVDPEGNRIEIWQPA